MLSGLSGHLPEIIIVLVVILIIWGPGKLPDVGAAMGKGIREFRKASFEAHDTVVGTSTAAPAPPAPAPAAQVTAPLPTAPLPAPAPMQQATPVAAQADATQQPSVSG
jgi:TatA/E family protein of Tat protein translocase